MLRDAREGFTLVEVVVALVILSTAVLGLATSAASLTTSAAEAELRALAQFAADDRIARIGLDSRYTLLDSLYDGVEADILDAPGFTRTTDVVHVVETDPDVDYTVVTVVVDGPLVDAPISRRLVVGAP
jgi:prepilin-type N-terminal cleavage/methylation domain-containing protein